MSLRGTTWL